MCFLRVEAGSIPCRRALVEAVLALREAEVLVRLWNGVMLMSFRETKEVNED